MITQQEQVKLNLPIALKGYLESKAGRFGMTLAGYLKHLILKDVEDMEYPIYQVSERTTKKAVRALKTKKKSIVVKDINRFFKNL